jgi:iron-sulfur cluster repair protein YtfE (RIC family)
VILSSRGRATARHLKDVHDVYRAEMLEVLSVLDQVRRGTANIGVAQNTVQTMTIRANDWALGGYCQTQCRALTQHHEMESEAIFPYLSRCEPSLYGVIERLNDEHSAIHELLENVDAALIELVQHPLEYGPITALMNLLHDTIMSHFAYEERELLGLLGRFGFYPGQI